MESRRGKEGGQISITSRKRRRAEAARFRGGGGESFFSYKKKITPVKTDLVSEGATGGVGGGGETIFAEKGGADFIIKKQRAGKRAFLLPRATGPNIPK